jgi:DNA mismatch endonuclease, patch repair protein
MDKVSPETRSKMMSSVRSTLTASEIGVRKIVRSLGRYFSEDNSLPGKPDLVFRRSMKVIFVHGCFWHSHQDCQKSARPKSNAKFWNKKLDDNIRRDRTVQITLQEMGWDYLIVWECELRKAPDLVRQRIGDFLTASIAMFPSRQRPYS